jgi:hypothetical protein
MVKPAMGALVMGIILLVMKNFMPVSLLSMEILAAVGFVVYIASMISMVGLGLIEDAKKSFKTIFSK